jgi:alpha/beta superfamily hydrolase
MDAVRFVTDDGVELEGELRRPASPARASAVICHAHPRRGGSKDHPLLWAIRNALAARGFAVLAFNFRGTMGSGGTHAGGIGEVLDVRAAVGRVGAEAPGPIVTVGWSFGASVALLETPDDDRVARLALVGIPLSPDDIDVPPIPGEGVLRSLERPVLLLAGDEDVFCPTDSLEELGRRLPGSDVEIVPGADHFFRRREREAADIVARFADGSAAGVD